MLKSFVGGVDSDEDMEDGMEMTPKFKLLLKYNARKLKKAQFDIYGSDMLNETEIVEIFEKFGIQTVT